MTCLRSSLLVLLLSAAGVSCAPRLPNATDMDRYYEVAQSQCKDRITELERRRSSGELDESQYKRAKTELDTFISDRAATLAWTAHDLRERGRAAVGIPTPAHPQQIAVPQAGSLPTGSEFRRFNQNDLGGGMSNSSNIVQDMINGNNRATQIAPPVPTVNDAEQAAQ